MSNVSPIITALRAISAPLSLKELDEQAVMAAAIMCDDLENMLMGNDIWLQGAGAALVGIHAAMTDMGHDEAISGITTDDIYKSDGILGENRQILLDALPHLGQYLAAFGTLQEVTQNFRSGAICAFFSVYSKYANVEEPEEAKVLTREDVKELNEPTTSTNFAQVVEGSFQPNIKVMIEHLVMAGIDIEDIMLKPRFKENGDLELAISGSLGETPDFDKIATINALFKAYGDGSSVRLLSKDGVIYYEHTI